MPGSIQEKRFLLIDEPLHGQLLRIQLTQKGVPEDHIELVHTVGDAKIRLADTKREQPSIVTINLDIGKQDGVLFLHDPDRPPVPTTIVFSAYHEQELKKECEQAGASYVEMPYDKQEFFRVIDPQGLAV